MASTALEAVFSQEEGFSETLLASCLAPHSFSPPALPLTPSPPGGREDKRAQVFLPFSPGPAACPGRVSLLLQVCVAAFAWVACRPKVGVRALKAASADVQAH